MATRASVLALLLVVGVTVGASATAPYTAPIEVLKTRHLVVRAVLNGKGPYRMVLDTGSPLTFVSTHVAAEIGLVDPSASKDQALFGMRMGLTLKSIDVGGAQVADLSVMVLDHPTVQMLSQVAGPIEGIVGMSFMGRFRTTLDYSTATVSFAPVDFVPLSPLAGVMSRMMSRSPKRVLAPAGLWGMVIAPGPNGAPRVERVLAGCAAKAAGLLPGDIVATIDRRWTDSVADCYDAASLVRPGQTVPVAVLRHGRRITLACTPRLGI